MIEHLLKVGSYYINFELMHNEWIEINIKVYVFICTNEYKKIITSSLYIKPNETVNLDRIIYYRNVNFMWQGFLLLHYHKSFYVNV